MCKCIDVTTDPLRTLSENKSTAKICNASRSSMTIVEVDGCYIDDPLQLKCDYLIHRPNVSNWYLELKGKDIGHALQQIGESIKNINKDFGNLPCGAIVVSSRCPTLPTYQKDLLKLKKSGLPISAEIKIKNKQVSLCLDTNSCT